MKYTHLYLQRLTLALERLMLTPNFKTFSRSDEFGFHDDLVNFNNLLFDPETTNHGPNLLSAWLIHSNIRESI